MPKVFWDGKEWTWNQDKKIRFDTYIDLWDDVLVPRLEAAGLDYEAGSGAWGAAEWGTTKWGKSDVTLFALMAERLVNARPPTTFDEVAHQFLDSYPYQTFDEIADDFMLQVSPQSTATWDEIVARMENMHVGSREARWGESLWGTGYWYTKSVFWLTMINRLEQAGE